MYFGKVDLIKVPELPHEPIFCGGPLPEIRIPEMEITPVAPPHLGEYHIM